eukprot:NODE_1292_length_567_cov_475.944015_g1217_i0.p2 GENE.NODE_1292_length_567_cov_475.944015_g1217_i0~~NODE_1292_length_567_cov_475.944015_g1217_i0.p2  ORF type:complete len:102 (-),score=22.61 NODE_1292_length_567_cov_475.944015_g1217_i0:185-490(-)
MADNTFTSNNHKVRNQYSRVEKDTRTGNAKVSGLNSLVLDSHNKLNEALVAGLVSTKNISLDVGIPELMAGAPDTDPEQLLSPILYDYCGNPFNRGPVKGV